jgi:hypothetical protein
MNRAEAGFLYVYNRDMYILLSLFRPPHIEGRSDLSCAMPGYAGINLHTAFRLSMFATCGP